MWDADPVTLYDLSIDRSTIIGLIWSTTKMMTINDQLCFYMKSFMVNY